jgi:hypothetical protein
MRAILTYHSIDSSGSPVSLSEQVFRAHARFLGSGRVKVVPLAELPAVPDEKDAVALTFDDGFLNFATTGLPVLSGLGLPATVFVVSDAVGGTNAWGSCSPGHSNAALMGWQDLRATVRVGFGSARTPAVIRPPTLSAAEVEDETDGCVERSWRTTASAPVRVPVRRGERRSRQRGASGVRPERHDRAATTRAGRRRGAAAATGRVAFQESAARGVGSPAFRRASGCATRAGARS